jgi:hypothetical protein
MTPFRDSGSVKFQELHLWRDLAELFQRGVVDEHIYPSQLIICLACLRKRRHAPKVMISSLMDFMFLVCLEDSIPPGF